MEFIEKIVKERVSRAIEKDPLIKQKLFQLAVQGFFSDVSPKEAVLLEGIADLKDYGGFSGTYYMQEPIVRKATLNALSKFDLPDLQMILNKDLLKNPLFRGKYFEVFAAHTFIKISKYLNGEKPLIECPIFTKATPSHSAFTILRDYTLEVKEIHFGPANQSIKQRFNPVLKIVQEKKDISKITFVADKYGPDLFMLLKCLPGSESYKKFGEHYIPLTVSCHTRASNENELFKGQKDLKDKIQKDVQKGNIIQFFKVDSKKAIEAFEKLGGPYSLTNLNSENLELKSIFPNIDMKIASLTILFHSYAKEYEYDQVIEQIEKKETNEIPVFQLHFEDTHVANFVGWVIN